MNGIEWESEQPIEYDRLLDNGNILRTMGYIIFKKKPIKKGFYNKMLKHWLNTTLNPSLKQKLFNNQHSVTKIPQ